MGKILLTCEKKDAAEKTAAALNVSIKNLGGYFEDDTYIITWAIGHLIRWKKPDEIDAKYKVWSLDPLPFRFDLNKDLTIDEDKKKQYSVIKKLINRADVDYIINAGDADREGLLIQEELYKFCGNKKPIKVLWFHSLSESEILKCMSNLKNRNLFINILEEAKARFTVDYMLGISYTRAIAKTIGNDNKISYGRCQTPLLKLLSDREKEITNFVSKDFYTIKADFDKGYSGILVKDDLSTVRFDNELNAKQILSSIGNNGIIEQIKEEQKEEKAPLLFSLPELQKYMGRKYKFSPELTLKIAQELYEKKLTSYPRADSEYINDDVYNEIDKHVDSACSYLHIDKSTLNSIECFKRCCKNMKVTGHHALIPTDVIAKKEDIEKLSNEEKLVYEAICKRFISILLNNYVYISSTILTKISKYNFLTKGIRVINEGYKALYKNEVIDKDSEENNEDENQIPILKEKDEVNAKLLINKDKTKPLPRYTGSTIISLMEKNHIGTPATMSNIIKTLIDREYITLNKNKYYVTKYGMDFIDILPNELKDPIIEQEFEEKLLSIEEGTLSYDTFIEETFKKQVNEIEKLKNMSKNKVMENKYANNNTSYKCPICGNNLTNMKFSINCDCGFKLNKEIASKKLSDSNINDLLEKGKTSVIKGFKSKKGTKFDCSLKIDKEKKCVAFDFK